MDPIRPNAGDLNDTSKADEIAASSVSKGNLTPEEQQAISDYRKTDLVWRANKHLRGQEGMLTKAKNAIFGPDQEMLKKIEHLDSAIKKSKTTQDMTVMRGFRLDQDPMKVFKPGSTFNEPAFASTTLARPVAEKFSTSFTQNQVLMEIDVPKGSNAHHMERREMEYDEAELLLARNAQFRVKSVNRRDDGKYVVNVGYEGSEPEKNEGGLHFDKGGLVPHHFGRWNAPQQPPKVPGKFDKLKKAAGHVGSAYSKYGKPVQTAGSIFSTMASIPGVDPMAMALSAMSFLAPAGMAADQPFVKATPDAQGSVDERTALMYAQLRKHQYEEAKTAGEAKPPIHKAEGGMIAPAPGVPVDADEVPIKAKANEFIMPTGPASKFRPQLEQMRAGQEPHFATGGKVDKQNANAGQFVPQAVNADQVPMGQFASQVPTATPADQVPTATPADQVPPAQFANQVPMATQVPVAEHAPPPLIRPGTFHEMGSWLHPRTQYRKASNFDASAWQQPNRLQGEPGSAKGEAFDNKGGTGGGGGSELVLAMQELTKELKENTRMLKENKKEKESAQDKNEALDFSSPNKGQPSNTPSKTRKPMTPIAEGGWLPGMRPGT